MRTHIPADFSPYESNPFDFGVQVKYKSVHNANQGVEYWKTEKLFVNSTLMVKSVKISTRIYRGLS